MRGMGEFALQQLAAVYVFFAAPGIAGFAILRRWFMKGLTEVALNV
jgi:hypothetical protein